MKVLQVDTARDVQNITTTIAAGSDSGQGIHRPMMAGSWILANLEHPKRSQDRPKRLDWYRCALEGNQDTLARPVVTSSPISSSLVLVDERSTREPRHGQRTSFVVKGSFSIALHPYPATKKTLLSILEVLFDLSLFLYHFLHEPSPMQRVE